MTKHKILSSVLSFMMAVSVVMGNGGQSFAKGLNSPSPVAAAMPSSPTDESKVPHYFGPYPNWANSPFTVPDASVAISGDGSGAAASATSARPIRFFSGSRLSTSKLPVIPTDSELD